MFGKFDLHLCISVDEIPKHMILELERFFEDYKALEGKRVQVVSIQGPAAANEVITNARREYIKHREELLENVVGRCLAIEFDIPPTPVDSSEPSSFK